MDLPALKQKAKQILCSICKKYGCCHQDSTALDSCMSDKAVLSSQVDSLKAQVEEIPAYLQTISGLESQVNLLKAQNEELSLAANKPTEKEEYWNKKYPFANVEYLGRTFPTTKEMIPIDVRLLVTPQDYHIVNEVKSKNLLATSENYEEKVVDIYYHIADEYYRYVFDQNNYGVPELWEFPFEVLAKKKKDSTAGFDCDSWADVQASYYIAAGIPAWKVKIVIGGCDLGGHSTVYVYSDKTGMWHHLNSTYGAKFKNKKELSEFPTSQDAYNHMDDYGINQVWFAFNNLHSWHKFTVAGAEEGFEKYKEKYRITPVLT